VPKYCNISQNWMVDWLGNFRNGKEL